MKRKAKIEIRHSSRGKQKFWYALVGGNGETMVASEKFDTRSKAISRAKRFLDVTYTLWNEDIVDAE